MGDIMPTITARQLADQLGVNPQTMEKRVRRNCPELSPAMSAPLSAEQIATLSKGHGTKSGPTVRKFRTVAPVTEKASASEKPETHEISAVSAGFSAIGEGAKRLIAFISALDTYLKAIIYAHAALVLADLVILYSVPGAIAGLLVGMFMHAATKLAGRRELVRTSGFAMSVVFILDALAWFVHVPAFRASLSADVSDIVTQVLAGVVCAMAFAALYVLRDSKLD